MYTGMMASSTSIVMFMTSTTSTNMALACSRASRIPIRTGTMVWFIRIPIIQTFIIGMRIEGAERPVAAWGGAQTERALGSGKFGMGGA